MERWADYLKLSIRSIFVFPGFSLVFPRICSPLRRSLVNESPFGRRPRSNSALLREYVLDFLSIDTYAWRGTREGE